MAMIGYILCVGYVHNVVRLVYVGSVLVRFYPTIVKWTVRASDRETVEDLLVYDIGKEKNAKYTCSRKD
jgi:hypothetical protein